MVSTDGSGALPDCSPSDGTAGVIPAVCSLAGPSPTRLTTAVFTSKVGVQGARLQRPTPPSRPFEGRAPTAGGAATTVG
jgi:hypothetical protein